mmetsp:Transcript_1889/g.3252  ORF Transcript_1889/g.3252 Transcript_1889/m.3252 type:complete len:228 (-) Transcript_1889:52-735(-)
MVEVVGASAVQNMSLLLVESKTRYKLYLRQKMELINQELNPIIVAIEHSLFSTEVEWIHLLWGIVVFGNRIQNRLLVLRNLLISAEATIQGISDSLLIQFCTNKNNLLPPISPFSRDKILTYDAVVFFHVPFKYCFHRLLAHGSPPTARLLHAKMLTGMRPVHYRIMPIEIIEWTRHDRWCNPSVTLATKNTQKWTLLMGIFLFRLPQFFAQFHQLQLFHDRDGPRQ